MEGKVSSCTSFTRAWVSMWGNICWVFTGFGAMCEVRITSLPETLCRPDERMAQPWLKTHLGICYTMGKTAVQPDSCSSAHRTSWSNTQGPNQMTSYSKYFSSSMWHLGNPPQWQNVGSSAKLNAEIIQGLKTETRCCAKQNKQTNNNNEKNNA